MSKIQIIVDGSSGVLKRKGYTKMRAVGWGIVAHFNGTTEEISGCRQVPWGFDGFHEHIAFIEGVLFARDKGFAWQDISIYSDHDIIPYAQLYMHKENFMTGKRWILKDQLFAVCCQFYQSYVTYKKLRNVIKKGRVGHMKGHERNIDMNRADYLARFGLKKIFDCNYMQEPLDHTRWLKIGFNYYDDNRTQHTWYPPFANTLQK